jgi:glycosyltransferase involved in cell wall biosynthesis
VKYLNKERPQVIISALPHANLILIIAKMLCRSNTKVVISERSIMSRYKKANFKLRLMLKIMRCLYPFADRAIAISKTVAHDLTANRRYPSKYLSIIHNPVNLERVRKLKNRPPKHEWLLNKSTPVIVSAGRLVWEKNHEMLIRSLASISGSPARLIIYGEGVLRGKLEALVAELQLKERVELPGFIDNPFAEFASCDLVVLPSKSEGFGNVIIEALACGSPVIATRATGSIADEIEDGIAVKLVDIDDHLRLGTIMDASLSCSKPTEKSYEISSHFSLESACLQYLKVAGLTLKRK